MELSVGPSKTRYLVENNGSWIPSQPISAAQRIANKLKDGGQAYLQIVNTPMPDHLLQKMKIRINDVLTEQGFSIRFNYQVQEGIVVFYRVS